LTGKLTLKQRRFIEAYIGEAQGNASEAAHLAGYSGTRKTLEATGRQNLANPRIAKAILSLARREEKTSEFTRQKRIEMLIEIANTSPKDADRLHAIDICNKMNGEYIQRHQVEVKDLTEREQTTHIKETLIAIRERSD